MNVHHDTATPTLSVIDSRSLMIRSVGYCRHPDSPDIDPRITRPVFDAAGRQVASWDPRLWGTAPKPNLATTYGLSGQALLTDSVDAGWQLSLPDQAGSLLCSWDVRGSECHRDYDDLQRPIVVTEQALGEQPRVVERLSYADADDGFAQHNQCGRLIRHDDPGGTRLIRDYGLAGAELVESRRMLTDLDLPDWPSDPEHRDVFLEEQSYVTCYAFYPTGELQRQTDAVNNAQTFHHDVAGKLSAMWLHPAGADRQSKCLVSAIRYNAHDQIEHETAGNGVMTRAEYSPEDGRLLKLSAAVGEQTPLQNLHYVYDPVGNIVCLEDKTQAVTYFNQQRIEPVSRYRYDSLYQLVEAKGWEVSQPSHGPALPDLLPTPLDPNQRRNYTQTFDYDAAGNLITRHHSGAPVFSMFTSACSNRSLAQRDDGSPPGEPQISEGFDRAGNQLELQRGQAMSWDVRNQLRRVTLVQRQDEPNDDEVYVYDRPGHRLRKTCLSQTSGQALKSEVRYLPGLEVHREANAKERHVISVEAGRNQVRMLHWPEGVEVDQLRFSLSDHLASLSLELDDSAGILSQEHYYPFGGTACWAGKSAVVAKYKTSRYSAKERDGTGLYYYGHRFYAPWLQRWISADPAGFVNGLNIFIFVSNNPIVFRDEGGRVYEGRNDQFERALPLGSIVARGLTEFPTDKQTIILEAFAQVELIYTNAQAAISSDLVDHAAILTDFFGAEYESVKPKVLDAFSKGAEWAKKYQQPWGLDRIVGVNVQGVAASVFKGDKQGRIFLNVNTLDPTKLAYVLSHELTHLKEVDGVAGTQAMDNFYLPKAKQRPWSDFFMKGMVPEHIIVAAKFPSARQEFVFGVATHSGVDPSNLNYDTAASLFNRNPGIRTRMASENADSIRGSASELSDRLVDSRAKKSG